MPVGIEPLVPYLFVLTAGLAAMMVVLMFRLRALTRQVAAASGDPDVLERIAAVERAAEAATRRVEHVGARVDRIGEQTARCLQRVGLVRYDAFRELGGRLSFSVALLDAKQDGVILSVLNDRAGARAYAKPVSGGRSTFTLSEEEQHAITQV